MRWEKFLKAMTYNGFVLTDPQEREFVRGHHKVAFAQEEELLSFCSLDAKLFKEENNDIALFRTPSLSDFLRIYQRSLLDGYRSNKGKKDQEKINLILINLLSKYTT